MAEKKEDKIRNDVLKQIPGLIKKSSKKISDTLKNRELCEKLLTGLESKIKKIPCDYKTCKEKIHIKNTHMHYCTENRQDIMPCRFMKHD